MVGNIYLTEKEKDQGTATRVFFNDATTKGGLLRFISPRNPQEEKDFPAKAGYTVTVTVTVNATTGKGKETTAKKTLLRKK